MANSLKLNQLEHIPQLCGTKKEDDVRSADQDTTKQREIRNEQQEISHDKITKKAWEPPTIIEIEINKSDEDWWLDDLQ